MIRAVGVSVATCGFVGYAPIAPGTAGSLAALMLWGGVRAFGGDATELWLLGGVGVCGPCGHRHRLLVGRLSWDQQRELFYMRKPMGQQTNGARGVVCGESVGVT